MEADMTSRSLIYILTIIFLTSLSPATPISASHNSDIEEFESRHRSRNSEETNQETKIDIDIDSDDEDAVGLKIVAPRDVVIDPIVIDPPVSPIPLPVVFPTLTPTPQSSPNPSPETTTTEHHNEQDNGNTSTTVDQVVTHTTDEDGKKQVTVDHSTSVQTKNNEIVNEFSRTNGEESPKPTQAPLTINLEEDHSPLYKEVQDQRFRFKIPTIIDQTVARLLNRIFN